jgi:Flp pilus assembly protein TadB
MVCVGVGLVILLLTRWPVAAVGSAIAVAVALDAVGRRKETVDLGQKAEAIAAWAEMLRDATSTPRGIEGVLVATASNAPVLIRPHVQDLARRLPYETIDEALDGLARDLDHSTGDLVVTALRLSAHTGGRQIRGVLDDLVSVAREEARMHLRVEVARARPRSEMRTVIMIMVVFVLGISFLARGYMEPYGTMLGQTVLVCVGACWAAGIWAMTRLGRHQSVERFLLRGVEP